ncbi:MAG: hypothetical protein II750_08650 [Bacteroidaceae bacterium]|nr:hypothetical protein [Bacteroidaceae bacterium]
MRKVIFILVFILQQITLYSQQYITGTIGTELRSAEPGNKPDGMAYQLARDSEHYYLTLHVYDPKNHYIIDKDKNYLVLYQTDGDSLVLHASHDCDTGFFSNDQYFDSNTAPLISYFMTSYTYLIPDINQFLSHVYRGYSIAGWRSIELDKDGSKFYKTFSKSLKSAYKALERRYIKAKNDKITGEPHSDIDRWEVLGHP